MNIKAKICGITRVEDALCAQTNGAWAIGYIFVPKSKRYIEPAMAHEISAKTNNIFKIGVFANFSLEKVAQISRIAKTDKIQLHGDETPEYCHKLTEQTDLPIIKAIRVKHQSDLCQIADYKGIVEYILLDTLSNKALGGTGESFDWNLAAEAKKYGIPIILAGGLKSQNIKTAIEIAKPFGIDISSGVEISPGIKSQDKINKLFNEIRQIEV